MKTHLSKLVLARRPAGEEIVPIAAKSKRKSGRLKGKGAIGPEFFEPLPDDELKRWE